MDFAAEPIMDAFTPPPRAVTRPNAPAADAGPTFDEHLEAVSESTAPESVSATSDEAKFDTATCETTPAPNVETQSEDQIDPDVALLGGPLPAPPPPQMSAPVLIQIAATQAAPTQAQPAETPTAPVNAAPQAPVAPIAAAPTPEATTPIAPTTPATPKSGASEAKSNAAPSTSPTQQQPASAPATSAQAETAAAQTTPVAANAEPISGQQLPEAVRHAIAATIAPAPQVAEALQRGARATPETVEAKAPEAASKSAAAVPNTPTKTQTAKAVTAPTATSETAPAVTQPAGSAIDATQIASSPSVTTTATQASTHIQHAAADVGTQRAAPAAAQVGQEVIRRFNGGNTSFELRLDPAELGRVEVRMEVSRDHKVTAVITADNPQALTELARQSRELEAQLQSAGLQLSDNGLSFDLRQGANGREAQDANGAQRGAGGEDVAIEQAQTPTARPIGFERWRGVRVDMMV